MFELTSRPAMLTSFNPRREKHGAEGVPAADLKFECNIEQALLAHFAPTLRSFLYHKDSEAANDLADQAHDSPNLRYPKLGPLKWESKYAGYKLCLHLGINEKSHLVIEDCDVNDFVIAPQEGGTITLKFRVQFHPDQKAAGVLAMTLAQGTVDISLTAPEGAREVRDGENGELEE